LQILVEIAKYTAPAFRELARLGEDTDAVGILIEQFQEGGLGGIRSEDQYQRVIFSRLFEPTLGFRCRQSVRVDIGRHLNDAEFRFRGPILLLYFNRRTAIQQQNILFAGRQDRSEISYQISGNLQARMAGPK
jgi:hypothetical protein